MLNMTVYEDSDPANLAIEAGKQFGLPPNQQVRPPTTNPIQRILRPEREACVVLTARAAAVSTLNRVFCLGGG